MRVNLICLVLLIAGLFGVTALITPTVTADQPERFEFVSRQWNEGQPRISMFEVWHDKQSGIEIVCMSTYGPSREGHPISCVTTGRNWK